MRETHPSSPRKVCRGNLRPAPFAITPSIVARVLALTPAPNPRAAAPASPPVAEITRLDSTHAPSINDNARLSPIRLAELAAECAMRDGVGKAMARELARQRDETRQRSAVTLASAPAATHLIGSEPRLGSRAPSLDTLGMSGEAKDGAQISGSSEPSPPRQARGERGSDVPAVLEPAPVPERQDGGDEPTEDAGAHALPPELATRVRSRPRLGSSERATGQKITSSCRHPVEKSGHDVDGARGGVSRSMPVPEASPQLSLVDFVAAEAASIAARRRVARKLGGGAGAPLPVRCARDPSLDTLGMSGEAKDNFMGDHHERELRRIDRRPAIRTSNYAERRAAQRAAEAAKAGRLAIIRAAAEKLRLRRESEAAL